MKIPTRILPVIVISQFCCTSLWFAGNGVMNELVEAFSLQPSALGHLTSSVQFGFISGTLVFAMLTIADRFSPSIVFFVCALFGAACNLAMVLDGNLFPSLLLERFLTGFFLAGIYPVGMKIASDYFEKGLGVSLGYLVGALVVGTAFPHLVKGFTTAMPWKVVLIVTTSLAVIGGLLMLLFVPNGPHRKQGQPVKWSAFFSVFQKREFRSAAFGYFGHMWELYAFWAFVPVMLSTYLVLHPDQNLNIPILTFAIIGVGGLSCVAGGYLSEWMGTKRTAAMFLFLSGLCCLFSPLFFLMDESLFFILFLMFWGIAVIADSPLFSTLVGQHAIPELKGTAFTIVNCVGFSITIASIQLLTLLSPKVNPSYLYLILAGGPLLGLIGLLGKKKSAQASIT